MFHRHPLLPLLLIAGALTLAPRLRAQDVPAAMAYQGRVSDNATQTPVNGAVEMRFAIWDSQIGGTELWAEPAAGTVSVTVNQGLFNVSLGGNGVPLPASLFAAGGSRYLELTVNGQTVTPRQVIASSGYAFRAATAGNAEQFGGLAPDAWQHRITNTCGAGTVISSIAADGSVSCDALLAGPKGDTGDIGPMGPQGPAGMNGLDGATGPMGPQGPAGLNGADGAQGIQGEVGPMGPQGPAGMNGLDGATGPMGPQGPAGLNGADGAQGVQGEVGPMGPQGPAGMNGLDGATGPMGPQGPAGLNGADGAQGIQGEVGPMGPQGPAGMNGLDGATGPMGPQGPAGLNGADGAQGIQGDVGPMGPQGPAGVNGLDGAPGVSGTAATVTRTASSDANATVEVQCSAGEVAIGGGGAVTLTVDGSATEIALTASVPIDANGNLALAGQPATGWRIHRQSATDVTASVFVICAPGT